MRYCRKGELNQGNKKTNGWLGYVIVHKTREEPHKGFSCGKSRILLPRRIFRKWGYQRLESSLVGKANNSNKSDLITQMLYYVHLGCD